MKLIEKNDPRYFTQTSDAPYDRHWYKVWCKDRSVKVLQSWEETQTAWWNFKHFIDYIEVIDAKPRGKSKGFK